jgi:hypothetical protein
MMRPRPLLSVLAFVALTVCAAVAYAQATVVVQVRTAGGEPGQATVTLTPQDGGGSPHSCRATDGSCRISGVPAGRYVVTAQPIAEGRPPIPRPVPIPPRGEVTVSVTLR